MTRKREGGRKKHPVSSSVMATAAMPQIPDDVGRVVTRYLELVEEMLPRRLEGLYLVGSVALDDYREGESDIDVVRTWTLNNLNSYWVDMAAQVESAASRLAEDPPAWVVVWSVSGVLRLAYTLVTGDVTSKSGACRYALTVYPERWHPVISDALALRRGLRVRPTSPSPLTETAALMRHVIQTENARTAR